MAESAGWQYLVVGEDGKAHRLGDRGELDDWLDDVGLGRDALKPPPTRRLTATVASAGGATESGPAEAFEAFGLFETAAAGVSASVQLFSAPNFQGDRFRPPSTSFADLRALGFNKRAVSLWVTGDLFLFEKPSFGAPKAYVNRGPAGQSRQVSDLGEFRNLASSGFVR